jgi:hypothetical protein
LEESYQGICFGCAFSKAYKFATIDENVCKDLTYVPIKHTQEDVQKYITWPKKYEKGQQKWNKPCVGVVWPPGILNTLVKTK